MVKKNAVVAASLVIAGAIVATYVLSGNMSMGVDGSGNSSIQQQSTAMSVPSNSTVVRIVANAGSSSFGPNPVAVKVGETVTWINDDSGRHVS
jgi:plastocyanin